MRETAGSFPAVPPEPTAALVGGPHTTGAVGAPVLVVGTFPPVGGPATDATLDVVRTVLRRGAQVRTAAVRPGGAEEVVVLAGPGGGRRLQALIARTGARRLVLVVDRGVPVAVAGPLWRLPVAGCAVGWVGVALLVRSLAPSTHVVLVVVEDPGVPRWVLRRLWTAADQVDVVAGAEGLADHLGVPTALRHGLERPAPAVGMVASGVTAAGPAEVTPVAMPRYMTGVIGRRILGRRFPWAHHQVLLNVNRATRVARAARSAVAGHP